MRNERGMLQIRGVSADTVVTAFLSSTFGSLIGLAKYSQICLKQALYTVVFLFLRQSITITIRPSQATDYQYTASITSNQYVVKHKYFRYCISYLQW